MEDREGDGENCIEDLWVPRVNIERGRQLRKEQEKERGSDQVKNRKSKHYAGLPYMKGITERLQGAFRKHNIALYAKASFTIRNTVLIPMILLIWTRNVGSYTH